MPVRLLLAWLVVTAAGCDGSAVQRKAEAARTAREAVAIAPERGRINGIAIGEGTAAVIAALGTPGTTKDGFDEFEGKPSRSLRYDGLEVFLVGGKVYSIECWSRQCSTADGVSVGDSVERVMSVMGPRDVLRADDGSEALVYPVAGADIELVVEFAAGRVIRLILYFDYA